MDSSVSSEYDVNWKHVAALEYIPLLTSCLVSLTAKYDLVFVI